MSALDISKGDWRVDRKPTTGGWGWTITVPAEGSPETRNTIAFLKNEPDARLMVEAPAMYQALQETMSVIRAFNALLAQHTTDDAIVGAMDALLDNPIWEETLGRIEPVPEPAPLDPRKIDPNKYDYLNEEGGS